MTEQKSANTDRQTRATPDDAGERPTSAKRPYKAPTLISWGTLADITQATGNRGHRDGARKPYSRTH